MSLRLALGISIVWVPLAFLFDGVTVLLLPLRLGTGGDAATAVGLVSFAGLGLATLAQPVAGLASDRLARTFDRRRFMALAAIPIVAGVWLLTGSSTLPLVALGYVVVQVFASALQAGQQALIPEHVEGRTRGRAAGLKSLFDVGGSFVAFAVLGTLLATGDTGAAAATILIVLAAALIAAFALIPATPRPAAAEQSSSAAVRSFPPGFWRLVSSRFLFLVGIYAVGRFMLLLVADRLAIPSDRAADETGALLAAFTLTTAVAAVALGVAADRYGRERMMTLGVLAAAAGIAILVPSLGLPGVVAGGLLMAIGTAAFVVANWAATTDLAASAGAGRLMGVANIGTGGAAACAGLMGPLIDRAGFAAALLAATVITLLAAAPLARPAPRRLSEEPA